jgi:hypothetical protein
VLAFGLVPPGICSCRLEALLLAPHESTCPEDADHEDCDCVQIHHEYLPCGEAAAESPDNVSVLAHVEPAAAPGPSANRDRAADTPSASSPRPLYLILRALLL